MIDFSVATQGFIVPGHLPGALMLLAALILEPWLGEARGILARLPHPVRVMGAAVAVLERKLNREERSPATRRGRGIIVVILVAGVAAGCGAAVHGLAMTLPGGFLLEIAAIITLVAQRSLFQHVARVGTALARHGLEAGREQVSHIVGRDVRELDAHAVARAAIESCAENFSDAVVAPAFWYLLLGLPGMMAYKAVNTLDSMIGHRSRRYQAFGWAAARLDDVMNLLPARLAGVYLAAAAAVVPHASLPRSLTVMWRDASKHRSPNAGWPEAAMAGALGLALAGPRRYPGYVVDDPWVGEGTARATAVDVNRALRVFCIGCGINALVVAAVGGAVMIFA